MGDRSSPSSLLGTQTETFRDEHDDYIPSQITEEDDEYIRMLCSKEKSPSSSLATIEDWIQCARLDSVAWILKVRAVFGLEFQTAYLSVTYLDQFLLKRSINRGNNWAIRLLSVACLSVAVKMEECTVLPLPEFFKAEEGDMYMFESSVVQKMELMVLSTLEWNMRLVTPFAYIGYFVVKFCGNLSVRSIIPRIVQIIMASMRDVKVMSHRPSVIALVATLVALDSKLTVPDLELKINAHASFSSGFLKMVDIVFCYNRMKGLPTVDNLTLPERVESRNLSRLQWGWNKCFENHAISGLSNKRKRLVFEDRDQEHGIRDEKRLG